MNDNGTTQKPSPTNNPSKPRNLTALAVGGAVVELSWQAPSSNGGARIKQYIVERTDDLTAPNVEWRPINTSPVSGAVVFKDTNEQGTGGNSYHYRVKTVNIDDKEGDPTDHVSVTTLDSDAQPGLPLTVAATPNGPAEINLTWAKPTTGNPTGYVIEYSSAASQPWKHADEVGGNVLKFSHKGLNPATVYYYRVAAKVGNVRGPVSTIVALDVDVLLPNNANGTHIDAVAKTTPKGVPAAPSGLRLRAVSSTEIEVYWSEVKSDNAPVTGYWVYHSSDGVTWTRKSTNNNEDPVTRTHTKLEIAVSDYRVAAVSDIGIGLVSGIESAIFPQIGSQPGAPGNLNASANDSASITLTWSAPATPGDPTITEYKVEYSKNATTPYLPWMELATVTSRTYTHTGLTPNTPYYYRVSAVGMDGRGPVDTTVPVVSATTEYLPPTLQITGVSTPPDYAEGDNAAVGEYNVSFPRTRSRQGNLVARRKRRWRLQARWFRHEQDTQVRGYPGL